MDVRKDPGATRTDCKGGEMYLTSRFISVCIGRPSISVAHMFSHASCLGPAGKRVFRVVGRFLSIPGLLSYPPGPVESVFLWRCLCRQKPPCKGGVNVFDVSIYFCLYWSPLDFCRANSGWPGDLAPGPWGSIPGPGRALQQTKYVYSYLR